MSLTAGAESVVADVCCMTACYCSSRGELEQCDHVCHITMIHSGTLCIQRKVTKFPCFGALSSELNFKTFFQLFGALFCCAVSSCVYDHNHPYLVSERLFLVENEAFPYLRRALAHPRRALAIL